MARAHGARGRAVIVALASPRVATSVDDALGRVEACVADAAGRGARIVCFPEAYVPGLRGLDFDVAAFDRVQQAAVLEAAAGVVRARHIAVVLGMEWITDAGRHIAAAVFDESGVLQGIQTKTQLDPTEEAHYVAGDGRRIFQLGDLTFGVAICHEGFRYPETVRWAASRGAQLVFHPHCTGSDRKGVVPAQWGAVESPYYEKAVMCRALENTIYVASVNYAFRFQESATSVIGPSGDCLAALRYGEAGVLVHDLDLTAATGLLARRYAPERDRQG